MVIFVLFKKKFTEKNLMLQRDSNSDRQSIRLPLDHHHGPSKSQCCLIKCTVADCVCVYVVSYVQLLLSAEMNHDSTLLLPLSERPTQYFINCSGLCNPASNETVGRPFRKQTTQLGAQCDQIATKIFNIRPFTTMKICTNNINIAKLVENLPNPQMFAKDF